ncbi:hypothetical protein QZH41_018283 [Actinostola sp. cb2023]|nr:hypothetical protein QZH41_018283 [Actinostola sp. cb2023]
MMTDYVLSVIHDTKERIDQIHDSGDISSLVLRLEYLNRTIVNRGELPDSIVSTIGQVIALLSDLDRRLSTDRGTERNVAERVLTGGRGRPSFLIKEEQLSFLIDTGFTVPQMSQMLGVSTRTVERRMSAFGISISVIVVYIVISGTPIYYNV